MAKINLGKVVPEKGVDYFTDAEIAQFKADVEADLDSRLDTDEANITTNANNISDNTSAISSLGTRMTTAEGDISTNSGNISSIGNRVTTLESDMTTAKSNIQTNAGDIDTLEQQQTIQDNAIAANTTALEGLANIPGRVTALETNDTSQDTKITNLEQECESLRHDLNVSTLDSTDTPGDFIELKDTVQARLKKFALKGKTEQVTTTGKNKFNKNDAPIVRGGVDTTVTVLDNGVRLTAIYSESNAYSFKLFKLMKLSDYVGQTIRMKSSFLASSNTLNPKYLIGICDNDGNGRSSKNSTSVSGTEISFIVSNEDSEKYLCFWLYIGSEVDIESGNYVDFTDVIVTIDNSDMTYEPYTGGIPSPNPSYPQQINNVEVQNLLPFSTQDFTINGIRFKVKDYELYLDGTSTSSVSSDNEYFKENFNFTLKAGTYMFNRQSMKGTSLYIYLRKYSDDSSITYLQYLSSKNVFTLNEDTKIYIGFAISNNTVLDNEKFPIQISSGEKLKPYIPPHCIQTKKCNKNKLNTSTCGGGGLNINGDYNASGFSSFSISENKITITTTTSYRGFVSDYIEVKPNTNYKLSYKTQETGLTFVEFYCFYDENKQNGTRNASGLSPANAKYMRVNGVVSTATTVNFYDIMVNEGSTAEPYVEHQEKTYNFPLSEGQFLAEDGTIENKVVNEWREVVFDGSVDEAWNFNESAGGNSTFFIILNDAINFSDNTDITTRVYCDKFKGTSASDIVANPSVYKIAIISNKRLYLILGDNTITTRAGIQSYLAENPIKAQYQLATPDETDFTTEQQAVHDEIIRDGTYEEVTYYSSLASINPDIDAVGIKDIRKAMENLDARLTLVEE